MKQLLKTILFKLPRPCIDGFYRVYNAVMFPEMREELKSFGELNRGLEFYVIRPRTDCVEGLMSLLLNVSKNLCYARQKGYIPVVDFKNYKTQYDEGDGLNAWEKFFEQVSDHTLDEVYRSDRVRLSGLKPLVSCNKWIDQSFDSEMLLNSRKLFRQYFRPQKAVLDLVEREISEWNLDKTVGLYLRGTDYVKLRPAGHKVQPTFEEACPVVDRILQEEGLDRVFLVTEDFIIFEKAKRRYGERLLTVSFDTYIKDFDGQDFLSKDSKGISQLDDSPYWRGVHYLVKILILSRCNSIVAGNTCGSWAACSFSEGYRQQFIFELGTY